jgi:hypothetical protein
VKALVQYSPSRSVPGGHLVYDVKVGNNSILAAAGCFDSSLLRVVFPDWAAGGELAVPNNFIFCPFGASDDDQLKGSDASLGDGVVYEHVTQVCGQLGMLVVNPRLDASKMDIQASAHDPCDHKEEGEGEKWIPGPTRSVWLRRRGDANFVFDGKPQLNATERLVLRIKSTSPMIIYPSDFLVTMRENLLTRRRI